MDVRRLFPFFPWLVRLTWVVLPFTLGPAIGAALHPHSEPVRLAAAGLAWAVWAAVLVGTLVPHPVGLTAMRVAAPAVAAVSIAAVATGRPSSTDTGLALASGLAVIVVAFTPATGMLFVNGPAYPNERRYPLRIPGPLLIGPVELAWLATVAVPVVGTLLLAARAWVPGAVVLVVGLPVAVGLARSLHTLARRWVVFVPAGVVLHDPLAVVDPVLFVRPSVETLRPAPAATDSLDLTQGAWGLALELVLWEKVPVVLVKPGRPGGRQGSSARLLFTPTRPGRVLAEAGSRRIPVG
jgi:hypothetical protein